MPDWLLPLTAASGAVVFLNAAWMLQRMRERSRGWPARFRQELRRWDGRLPDELDRRRMQA